MRNQSLVRALSLKATLESGRRWTLSQLSRRFGVTERTIRRDLRALEEAGVPVCHQSHEPGNNTTPGTWWVLS